MHKEIAVGSAALTGFLLLIWFVRNRTSTRVALLLGGSMFITVATSVAAVYRYRDDSHSELAPGVTARAIRSLKLGMTSSEVVSVLGPPFEDGRYSHDVEGTSWFASLSLDYADGRLAAVQATRNEEWLRLRRLVFYESPKRPRAFERWAFSWSFPP